MWSWQLRSDRFRTALTEFLEYGAPQAHKYVISQVPLFNNSPMRIRRFEAIGLGSLATRNDIYLLENDAVKKIVETGVNVTYLALDDLALFEQAPIFQREIIYYDESHMNEIGINYYAGQAKKKHCNHPRKILKSKEIW